MAKKVERIGPGYWLRITDAGMAVADRAIDVERPSTFGDRIKAPFGKGIWDLVKIGLGAVLGVLAAKYFGV
jgi:hypothetical protein